MARIAGWKVCKCGAEFYSVLSTETCPKCAIKNTVKQTREEYLEKCRMQREKKQVRDLKDKIRRFNKKEDIKREINKYYANVEQAYTLAECPFATGKIKMEGDRMPDPAWGF